MRGLNVGSGQRPFTSTPGVQWINIDSQSKWKPDIVGDGSEVPFPDDSVDFVVLNHVYEHSGLGEADGLTVEAFRVLKPGGSLIVTVPDLRALAHGFIAGRLDTTTYAITLYGAFMGSEDDRHRFGYDRDTLIKALGSPVSWSRIGLFDWRDIPGSSIPKDWWILGIEAIK